MPEFARRSGAVLAYVTLLTAALPVEAIEVSGRVEIEPRVFFHSPEHSFQNHHGISLAIEPEFYFPFQDDRRSLVFTPFLRVDSADGRRSHFDVRELTYQWVFDDLELRAGVGRVFWGVTESYSLVDVINQTDVIEDVGLKEKLGQPMVNLTLIRDWGALDFFVLPGFRERTYPGRSGRLRTEPYVDTSRATYESEAGRDHIDFALRWSHAIGDFDIGLAHFRGTGREPTLSVIDICADGSSAKPFECTSPAQPVERVLEPHYGIVHRTSLDLQATTDSMLWKLELLNESAKGDSHTAWVGGFEYTWYGINATDTDLGLLVEHLYDDRGDNVPGPLFEDDIFLGLRLGLNDEAGTEFLAAAITDTEGDATALAFSASRRIGNDWKLEFEARAWAGDNGDPIAVLRRDDYLQLTISHFF